MLYKFKACVYFVFDVKLFYYKLQNVVAWILQLTICIKRLPVESLEAQILQKILLWYAWEAVCS